jgi:hypothetical protein
MRNKEWEFIVNPIVDVGFSALGEADFLPAPRLARNLGEERLIGVKYYTDLGKIGDFLPFEQQRQQIFGVTDFKLGVFDVELGFGYGLTSGSDRLIAIAIIGYDFPVPGATNHTSDSAMKVPPTMKAPPRQMAANVLNYSASAFSPPQPPISIRVTQSRFHMAHILSYRGIEC